jgi:hypothetical protein
MIDFKFKVGMDCTIEHAKYGIIYGRVTFTSNITIKLEVLQGARTQSALIGEDPVFFKKDIIAAASGRLAVAA